MATYLELAKEIRMYLPGCPDFLILKEIRNGAIKFCQESRVFHETAKLTTVVGVSEYFLPTIEEAVLVSLKNARINGKTLEAKSNDQLPEDGKTGEVLMYTERNKEIVFYPEPSISQEVVFNYVLKPSRESTEIPDYLAEDYYLGITAYAVYRLTTLPERTWTSPQIAAEQFATYQSEVVKAKRKAQGQVDKVRVARFSW